MYLYSLQIKADSKKKILIWYIERSFSIINPYFVRIETEFDYLPLFATYIETSFDYLSLVTI
jgi:hypothetical protein